MYYNWQINGGEQDPNENFFSAPGIDSCKGLGQQHPPWAIPTEAGGEATGGSQVVRKSHIAPPHHRHTLGQAQSESCGAHQQGRCSF